MLFIGGDNNIFIKIVADVATSIEAKLNLCTYVTNGKEKIVFLHHYYNI